MNRGQTGPLSGVVEASQLMIPQREISVASFHIGAGALEHLRERFGLGLELILLHGAQRPKTPSGSNSGVRRRSANARSGSPAVTVRVEATRSR